MPNYPETLILRTFYAIVVRCLKKLSFLNSCQGRQFEGRKENIYAQKIVHHAQFFVHGVGRTRKCS